MIRQPADVAFAALRPYLSESWERTMAAADVIDALRSIGWLPHPTSDTFAVVDQFGAWKTYTPADLAALVQENVDMRSALGRITGAVQDLRDGVRR